MIRWLLIGAVAYVLLRLWRATGAGRPRVRRTSKKAGRVQDAKYVDLPPTPRSQTPNLKDSW